MFGDYVWGNVFRLFWNIWAGLKAKEKLSTDTKVDVCTTQFNSHSKGECKLAKFKENLSLNYDELEWKMTELSVSKLILG